MGLIGNVIPFSLINWGEVRIDSGLAAILMSTVPLATILLAPAFVRDEPITAGKLIGIGIGMAGVAVLIGGRRRGPPMCDQRRTVASGADVAL